MAQNATASKMPLTKRLAHLLASKTPRLTFTTALPAAFIALVLLLLLPPLLLLPHATRAPTPRPRLPTPATPSTKVFGIGVFKTGTTSLAAALEVLGFHAAEYGTAVSETGVNYTTTTTTYVEIPEADGLWPPIVHVYLRESDYWPKLREAASRATALADGPWFYLFREWDEEFPGSKFVLTKRKGGGRSVAESDLKMWKRMGLQEQLRADFNESELIRRMTRRYDFHIEAVREHFKGREEQLLEICFAENDDETNWRTLVDFLYGKDKPIPNQQFPRLNTKEVGFE